MNTAQIEAFYPLALAVRRLFHKLGHGIGALHASSEVSAGMRAVLESVIEGRPQTVPQLARARPVTRQHIQSLVNPLLQLGLVEYVDNAAHKRSKLVSPTAQGVATYRALRAREEQALAQVALDLSPEELRAAARVLRALLEVFDGREWRAIASRAAESADR